ncbi:ornithine-oxo-acid aminotransferase [Mycena albidolilacea]|uniref:Ornithine aminotransferase n=1 Tax=Mycena albidolilacea TaxID=1033008 RepID=A0AAD6Z368_9AGAR|nr:ornithine-oxo-acid aminotransferase [Mycena albidolilacea]
MSPSATTTAAPASNGNGAIKAKNGVNGSANGVARNGNGVAKNGKEAHLSSMELIRLENEHGAHNYHPLPVVFDRALGAKVWDPEGREYIDMISAYSAVNQGHCHPRIVAALVAQAQKLMLSSCAFHNSVFGRFAKRVGSVFGWEMVLLMNTGAEAVESKGVPEGEAIVLSVADNFHGRTLGHVHGPLRARRVRAVPPRRGADVCGPRGGGGGAGLLGLARSATSSARWSCTAFLVEPVQGEAGIIVPPPTYLPAVAALCKKHNVLLICDEIQTGLGRTGTMLAIDHAGIRPDIVLLGKALSGGVYPVSAVLADKDVMLCIQPGEHGSTYGGNPLACAVAITALDVLVEEDLSARAARLGEVFRSSVLALKSPYIKTVRGLGLLNAVVIDEDACNAARAARGQDVAGNKRRTAWQFCLLLKARGVLAKTTHGNVVRFAPPLVIEEADLVKAVKIIGECLVDLERLGEISGDDSEEGGH